MSLFEHVIEFICMLQSWYLAADLQLVLLSALLRPRTRGLGGLLPLLGLCVAGTFLTFHAGGWPAIPLRTPRQAEGVFADQHFMLGATRTHVRAAPYVVGLVFGVVLLRLKAQAVRLSGWATRSLTALGALLALAVLLSSVYINTLERLPRTLQQAAFAAATPVLFTAGLGVLLVAFVFGEETLLRDLLSWQPIVTLSRLAYGANLINIIFVTMSVASLHDAKKASVFTGFSQMFTDVTIVMAISFWLYMVIECPSRRMARSLMNWIDGKSTQRDLPSVKTPQMTNNESSKKWKES